MDEHSSCSSVPSSSLWAMPVIPWWLLAFQMVLEHRHSNPATKFPSPLPMLCREQLEEAWGPHLGSRLDSQSLLKSWWAENLLTQGHSSGLNGHVISSQDLGVAVVVANSLHPSPKYLAFVCI